MDSNNSLLPSQKEICSRYGVLGAASPSHLKIGITLNVKEGVLPINGLRHPPEGDTTGWYIWAGEEMENTDDFFVPLHVEHLEKWCPEVIPYLGLPAGWRFLIAPEYEDVWEDKSLLDIE